MTSHYDPETLIDYLHGALDPQSDAAVFAHLEGCATCREAHAEEAAFGERLRAAARAEERELPALVKARLWQAVRAERPAPLLRLRRAWPALPAAVAAAALVAYFGVAPALHGGGAPGISAASYLDVHAAEVQNPLGPGITPAVYDTEAQANTSASALIQTADAATLGDADGALR